MALLPVTCRPRRWTSKGVVIYLLTFYFALCILFDMPVFSSKLPKYSGEYDVGVVDIELPCEKRRLADVVHKATGLPAFELDTVLFSLYYPAVKGARSKSPHHRWVERPLSMTGEGYARFAKANNFLTNGIFTAALWLLVGSTTVPANVDVPIHGTARTVKTYEEYDMEQPIDDYGLPEFPVIVFSHGMASGRASYTQWCGEMASRGFIIAAIEHRDGSGPGTIIKTSKTQSRQLHHFTQTQLDPVPDNADFKVMQIAMRQAEIEETVRVLRKLNSGRGAEVYKANLRGEGQDLDMLRGRLNMNRIAIAGHSFGATAALQTLKRAPDEARPFIGGIMMDPGKHSGPLNDDINVPIVVVHSQSWSAKHSIFLGRPHFSVVKELVQKIIEEKKKKAWFVTAKGTTHPSITDAPLIEPFLLAWTTGSTIDAQQGVLKYVQISRQFMHFLSHGHEQSILRESITHPEYDETTRPYPPQISKYWQIHMAPDQSCPTVGFCGTDDKDDMDDP